MPEYGGPVDPCQSGPSRVGGGSGPPPTGGLGCRPVYALVMPAIPTNGLAQSSGIILAIRIIRPRGVLSPNARGIKPDMYQTLGSPEQSIIVRSFDCLVIEVQVIPPLLDQ
jgi:hypothetical protein